MVKDWQIAAKAILPAAQPAHRAERRGAGAQPLPRPDRPRAGPRNGRSRAAAVASLRATFTEHELPRGRDADAADACTAGRPPGRSSTHSNAFDTELFLRIAPELFLKRAVVGGIERVFEINRNFRNEGADSTHSPEFAMLEAYQAYGDYNQIADLTQELIQNAAMAVSGSHVVTWADGTEFDLGGEWDRHADVRVAQRRRRVSRSRRRRRRRSSRRSPTATGIEVDRPIHGKLVEELWEHFVKARPGAARPS